MGKNSTEVQSVKRLFDIVEAVIKLETTSLSAIAKRTDLPESTTYRYLVSLEENGYVVREDGEFNVGLPFSSYRS